MYAAYFANFFDTATMVATGLSLPAWVSILNIDNMSVGLLSALGVNAFGAAIGALFSSILSDRFGRKKTYGLGLIFYPIGLLFVIFASNFTFLASGILILGCCVGLCVPVSWTYLAEESKSTKRSSNLGFSQIARPAGIISMYIIFYLFSNILGSNDSLFAGGIFINAKFFCSKILFMFLMIMSILSLLNLRNIDESKEWSALKTKEENKNRVSAIKLLASKATLLSFLFLVFIYAPWNTVAGTLGQFSPSIAGLGSVESSTFALISICTLPFQFISVAIFSRLVKKHTHRSLFVVGNIIGLIAIASLLSFCLQIEILNGSLWWLIIVFCAIWNSQSGFSAQCFYSIWSSELFPTKIRGRMQGIMFFVVRSISGLWSIFAIGMLDVSTVSGAKIISLLMIVLLLVAFIIGTIFCPKTQDKSLKQISEERYGNETKVDENE